MSQTKEDLIERFAGKLRQLRLRRGWSQGQLGKKIEVDLQCISKYERGISWPPPPVLIGLASVFEVSLDYLLRDEEDSAVGKISNPQLLKCIVEINSLPEEEQTTLISVLDAFVTRHRLGELTQNRSSA